MDLRPHIEKFRSRFAEVESQLSDPKVFDNQQRARELSREYGRLKELVAIGSAYLKVVAELADNRALLDSSDAEMIALAKEEIVRLEPEEQKLTQQVRFGLVPPAPSDSRNTIIEIRAGAGGSESALFAADLYRMYSRYCEARGWKVVVAVIRFVIGLYKRVRHSFWQVRPPEPCPQPIAIDGKRQYRRDIAIPGRPMPR